jgi:lysophospholipase L1-like esterase
MYKRYRSSLLSFYLLILFSGCKSQSLSIHKSNWVGSWATAQQLVEPHNVPPNPGLTNNTLRQIIRVSIGGENIRLRFSNLFSDESTVMESVTVAHVVEGAIIDGKSLKQLTFGGKSSSVTMEAKTDVFSDSFDFPLQAGQLLAITIHYGKTASKISGHPGSRTTSFLLEGDHSMNVDFSGAIKTDHWYTIMGVDVMTPEKANTIVCLGNSITDGRGSGTNKQNRWTDILSERLLTNNATNTVGVLNLGIGGNCVLRGGLGPTALERFDRDVLSQNGVKWLILLEGINDIGGIRKAEDAPVRANELIEAYKIMINKAHAKGIKVYGCTILPFKKSFYDADFKQEARSIVNEWIRSSKSFDAVIDFDKVMESNTESQTILSDMHDNDFLHPNEKGYRRLGEAIDLGLFKI